MAQAILSAVVAALLAAWFALTVLNQYRIGRLLGPIRKHDLLYLIPVYTYFAPKLGVMDWVVLYRDRLSDGTLTAWHEARCFRPSPVKAVFHPDKRIRYAVYETVLLVMKKVGRCDADHPLESHPDYRTLLNFVQREPSHPDALARQFMTARSERLELTGKPEVMFVSPFHQLPC